MTEIPSRSRSIPLTCLEEGRNQKQLGRTFDQHDLPRKEKVRAGGVEVALQVEYLGSFELRIVDGH